ncbi:MULTISPECIES: recombinase family protein [unclassified Synechococcus]|uniref:recombinase family protein n=1 Tax=unclassified Synechococcus TaxID=2626047 RepID=UPI0039AF4388
MASTIGYARCSTTGQDLTLQRQALTDAGVDQLFSEHISGAAPYAKRVELQAAIAACSPGDVLVVAKLDRLGRSMEDCVSRVAELLDQGIHVRTLDKRVDTKGLGKMAKMVVGILAAAAEIERELIWERTQEGIREARAKGVPFGPKRKWSDDEQGLVLQLRSEGKSYGAISKATGKTISTIRRMLARAEVAA